MIRRSGPVLNVVLMVAIAAWCIWLLTMAKSKTDYLAERLGDTQVSCEWTQLTSPAVATLGVSPEEHHAWTDRSPTYIAFRAPALPSGGVVELAVIALATKPLDVTVHGQRGRVRIKDGGFYPVPLDPSDVPSVMVLSLKNRNMQPPTGNEQRWLGAALGQLRVCPGSIPPPP